RHQSLPQGRAPLQWQPRRMVWSDDQEAAFLGKAPKHLLLPFLLAIWTAQRQGDLLRLLWSAYDGSFIRLRQGKTGVRVTIPVGAPLKLALDAALTFHDLRGSAITRLAIVGATVPEIATISGLSLGDVRGILDKHYLKDDVALAEKCDSKT